VGRRPAIDESDYWVALEYRICREVEGFAEEPLRRFWCDGLEPLCYHLDPPEPCVRGRAWFGPTGQDVWDFTLLLDPATRARSDVDWAALLPDERLTGWLSPRPHDRRLVIDPLGGHPD
jgi:hypothetical protein